MTEEVTPVTPAPVNPVEVLAAEAAAAEVTPEGDYLPVRDKKFRLVDEIPGITMLKLSAASDPKTPIPAQMSAIFDFFDKIVVVDERAEFMDFLADAIPVIQFEELNEILTNATEIIGGRPTSP